MIPAIKKLSLLSMLMLSLLPTTATAQNLGHIANLLSLGEWDAIGYANGDKVAVGRFNTLHVVWRSGSLIKYSTSVSGLPWTWSTPQVVATGTPASLPAIASDSDGTLVVAFVAYPNPAGIGKIYYARKPWGGSWTPAVEVVTSGTQPDIEARGGRVYLTWTTLSQVQFTSFPTSSPPAPMVFGEEIEVAACSGTGFTRPSIALVRESCKLVPKVAYLRYSDERNNPDPACLSVTTEVGPRVCTRNPATGVWSLEYSDLISETLPATGVEPVSLSMNAQYTSGHTFLAWSDTSNGAARTKLAHGQNGGWSTTGFSETALHAHVAVKKSSTAGDYRLAWVLRDGTPPFVDWAAAFRTGQWSSGATPTWTDPSPILLTDNQYNAGYPQATYWGRCSNQSYTTMEAIATAETACAAPAIKNHFLDEQDCPGVSIVASNPCVGRLSALVFSSRKLTHIDTSELGVPVRFGRGFVELLFSSGGKEGRATLNWDAGELVEWGPDHFVIDNPGAQIRVATATHRVELVRLADNYTYDAANTNLPKTSVAGCLGEGSVR